MSDTEKSKGGRPKKIQQTEYYAEMVAIPLSHSQPGAQAMLDYATQAFSQSGAEGWKVGQLIVLPRVIQYAGEQIQGESYQVLVLWERKVS